MVAARYRAGRAKHTELETTEIAEDMNTKFSTNRSDRIEQRLMSDQRAPCRTVAIRRALYEPHRCIRARVKNRRLTAQQTPERASGGIRLLFA